VFKVIGPLTSLFISCFILFLGNGLINVLLPVRMGLDGASTDEIGLVLSLYYVGMLFGAIYSKYLIVRAGHIRMYAGCVAIATVCILLCSLYSEPVLWGAMRLVIGFCNACAFTAIESWLSDSSTKTTRGKVLAMYNAAVLAGLFGGQFFMNVASPADTTLFVISGILLCAAIVPVVMSGKSGPVIDEVISMSLAKLYKTSPLGVVCCLTSGLVYSALFNLLPVFAGHFGIVEFQLSLYMAAAIFGAFVLQFPVGYLSDRYDRRSVLLSLLLVSATAGMLVVALVNLGHTSALFFATAVTSGIIACIYPLSVAESFDRLRQSEMVAAMGSMILAFSLGGVLGPFTASIVMTAFGSEALFYYLALVQLLLAAFVVYRMSARHALPVTDQESFVMQGVAMSSAIELDPRAEYIEQSQPLSAEAEAAVTVAEIDPASAVRMAKTVAIKNPHLGAGVAAAVATVDGIDVLGLYQVMKEAIPEKIQEVTHAIVTTRPDLAYELVSQLAQWQPDEVVAVAAQISTSLPELRVEMARVAVEAAPESATEVAQYYAQVLAEELGSVRHAEREDDNSQEEAVHIATQLWQGADDQAVEVAAALAGAIPESAVSLAQEYIVSHSQGIGDDLIFYEKPTKDKQKDQSLAIADSTPLQNAIDSNDVDEAEYQNSVALMSRLTEAAPDKAMDLAVAVAQAIPGSAAEVAAEYAAHIGDKSESNEQENENEKAVELVHRLTEVAPDNAMDVAVAVVEAVPGSAVDVATEYAEYMFETKSIIQPGYEEAVELVQRLSEVSPDNSSDVVSAVVEVLPESASEIVGAIKVIGAEPD
jgi:MFS family permease